MPLSAPAPRRHLHTRRTTAQGFLRDDGLWDIEAHMLDTRAYTFTTREHGSAPPETPVHGLWVRLTVGNDLRIVAAEAFMEHTPFAVCTQAEPSLQGLVGETLGPGWRQTIARVMGKAAGCTHLRELLFNMATVAYQTIWPWHEHERLKQGLPRPEGSAPPPHLGQCMTWAWDSPTVQRLEPRFYRPVAEQPHPESKKVEK